MLRTRTFVVATHVIAPESSDTNARRAGAGGVMCGPS
jgi:hypothetical protein